MQAFHHHFPPSVPVKRRMTARTPHLRAAFDAKDAVMASGALLRLFLNSQSAGHIIGVAGMDRICFTQTNDLIALGASEYLANTAFILRREHPITGHRRARHKELFLLFLRILPMLDLVGPTHRPLELIADFLELKLHHQILSFQILRDRLLIFISFVPLRIGHSLRKFAQLDIAQELLAVGSIDIP